ncbi:hypothetical protein [Methylobacterium gossipiicola]|uniref:Phage regulatory protein Rha (Phage_pRha) n=1 Tax=Methylobacterium gossipiicola TaxID=582675 RepID=A0A1I2TEL2_9HYPH|nr:hypothetical protein [Methylobacterium gossipiicola]SFG63278.1 hypothetical protein SAMN05192565_10727 [Methylobacterium gossipiicola]
MPSLALTVHEVEGEPRVLDTDLAKALGMAKPAMIRSNIIEPNRATLEQFGSLPAVKANPGPKGGRPTTAFYLNEEQALYVTMHCRTERANAVKVEVVKVFTAWRRGTLQPLVPAQPALPNFADPIEAALAFVQAERGRREEAARKEPLKEHRT